MKVDSNYSYYEIVFVDGWSVIKTIPKDWDYDYSSALAYILSGIISLCNVVRVYLLYGPNNSFRKLIAEY